MTEVAIASRPYSMDTSAEMWTNGAPAISAASPLPNSGSALITPPEPQIPGKRRFSFSFDILPATPPTPILPDTAFQVVPDADSEVQKVCSRSDEGMDLSLPPVPDVPGPSTSTGNGAPDLSAVADTPVVTVDASDSEKPNPTVDFPVAPAAEENVMTKMLSILGRRRRSVDVWSEDLYDESEVRTTLPAASPSFEGVLSDDASSFDIIPHRRVAILVESADSTTVDWTIENLTNAQSDLIVLVHVRSPAGLETIYEGIPNSVAETVGFRLLRSMLTTGLEKQGGLSQTS
ncbi:hypothetical protein HDU96_008882 [Phlyctochytrium bullatum]|nr:hypothetical protein HDU96_008882 [Phlyctochytrium bullatum]